MKPTAPNFKAWDIDVVDSRESTPEELLLNLIGWGVLAPSSHNVQPWRFIIYPETCAINVCLHKSGVLKHSDPKGRQAHISMGCALHNILIVAEFYDLETKAEYYPGNFYPVPIARLMFSRREGGSGRGNRKILDAMKNRRMNRGKFDPLQDVPKTFIDRVKTAVEGGGLTFNAITDLPTKFALAEFQYSASRAVVAINNFRQELAEFFLPNDTDRGSGMPGNTFGLTDEMAEYVHRELGKSGSFDPDLAFGMAASDRDGIKSSPLIGVISVPEDLPVWWVKAGMAFEKIALEAEAEGLGVAVHAAIVEVDMFNKLLRIRLGQNWRPMVIFRLGYAKEERPHAPRLRAEEVSEIKRGYQ